MEVAHRMICKGLPPAHVLTHEGRTFQCILIFACACRTLVTTEECLLHPNRRDVDQFDRHTIETEFRKLLGIEKVDILTCYMSISLLSTLHARVLAIEDLCFFSQLHQ